MFSEKEFCYSGIGQLQKHIWVNISLIKGLEQICDVR